jgi:hypothetical protein
VVEFGRLPGAGLLLGAWLTGIKIVKLVNRLWEDLSSSFKDNGINLTLSPGQI